ncbi:MAG: hypothetical protein ABMA64_18650 [Myxococcota bacterium]
MLVVASFWLGASALAAPEGVDQVVRALSARDGVTCGEVEALTGTPVETLRAVVDTVAMPPWVPMRAAQCLMEQHAVEVKEDLLVWVSDPAKKGLGFLVLAALDRLPIEVAVPVAQKALAEGPDHERAVAKVGAAAAPELRALVSR